MAAQWRWSVAVLVVLAAVHLEATPTWHMSDIIAAVEKLELSNPGAEPVILLHALRGSAPSGAEPFLQHFLAPDNASRQLANATTPAAAFHYLVRALDHRVRGDGKEEGVVLASDGTTVAPGPMLLGLEAAFRSMASRGQPRGLYELTLAGALARAVRDSSDARGQFPDGCWDSLSSPREFTLSGRPRGLSRALMQGGMDGVILGMSVASTRPRGGVSLSSLLRSYYDPPGGEAGAPGLIAAQRRENFKRLVGKQSFLARRVVRSLELQLSLEGRPKVRGKERKKMVALVNEEIKGFALQFMECPPIVPRCMWQAAPYRGTPTLLSLPLPFLYIHHTSTPSAPCLTFERCSADMRSMQRFHQDVRGWDDIGYSFVAGSDGRLYEGRGWHWRGAHTLGHNEVGYGVAFIGDYMARLPVNSSLELVREELASCAVASAALAANYTVQGHRQVVPGTDCPGGALFQEIKGWPHFGEVTGV